MAIGAIAGVELAADAAGVAGGSAGAGAAAAGASSGAGAAAGGGLGGIISGASGILGDVLGFGGQQATNATNLQIARMNNEFNAQQAALNRTFQANQLQGVEAYNTQMSDTAYQRAVAGLKAAGLNPLLAYGNPASTPTVGAPSGSVAQASGNPVMQNPAASFARLGDQVTNAVQQSTLDSEIQKNQAQATAMLAGAKKDTSQTFDPGQFSKMIDNQMAGVTASAAQANQTVDNLQAQIKEIDARVQQIGSQTRGQDISNQWVPVLNDLTQKLQQVQLQINQLQVPKQQVEAGIAGSAASMINKLPQITDSVGSYIGNKAADLTDWVKSTQDTVHNWLFNASGRPSPRGGYGD